MTESVFEFSNEGLVIQAEPKVVGSFHIKNLNGETIEIPYQFDFSDIPPKDHEYCLKYLMAVCGLR